ASYLLNTRGNYSELKRIEGRSTELHKNNVNGYMDGIKRSALAASLGYKYQLSERFNFGARITREFTRPYDQDAFYGVNNKPLWSLQALMTLKIY
ncbi:MAG: hypothetical protein ABIQ02_11025, partial [Saprospiraceae bacterium]